MKYPSRLALTLAATAALALSGGRRAVAEQSAQTMTVTGLTAPSDVRKIGFDIRGVVAHVDVKKNDPLKAGQPLLSLDDTAEAASLKEAQIAADTSLDVAEAEQTYNVKQIEYTRKKQVFDRENNGSAELEMKQAEAEMNVAKIHIDEARHKGAESQARADSQAATVARMHKSVPADFASGQVSDVLVKQGEQVDETKPVMEIVSLDPLYVDVTLADTSIVQQLKLGQKILVKYADETKPREATVDAIDPSADRRSGKTHPFRLSLPNPEHRYAGLRVDVQLPATAVASGN